MTMNMNKLAITITDNGTQYVFGERRQDRADRYTYTVLSTSTATDRDSWTNNKLTDYAGTVFMAYASTLSYVGLRKIWIKSGSEQVRRLMNDCVALSKASETTQHDYTMDCETDYMITSELLGKKSYTTKKGNLNARGQRELMYAQSRQASTVVTHNYTVAVISTAKIEAIEPEYVFASMDDCEYSHFHKLTVKNLHRVRRTKTVVNKSRVLVRCPKWREVKKTVYGRLIDNINLADDMDIWDCVQTVNAGLTQLCQLGLINCPADIWTYQQYAYTLVRNWLYRLTEHNSETDSKRVQGTQAERRQTADVRTMSVEDWNKYNMEQERKLDCVGYAKKCGYYSDLSDRVARSELTDAIINLLKKALSNDRKNKNIDNRIKAFEAVMFGNYSLSETGAIMGLSKMAISKYVADCVSKLQNSEVYDILTSGLRDKSHDEYTELSDSEKSDRTYSDIWTDCDRLGTYERNVDTFTWNK